MTVASEAWHSEGRQLVRSTVRGETEVSSRVHLQNRVCGTHVGHAGREIVANNGHQRIAPVR